jgi:hypothetical protein
MTSVHSTAQFIAAEQAEFAAMLRTLPPEDWSTPSLCSTWSVRDVVIHTAAHIHNQQNDHAVISQFASGSEEALVAWLESPPAEPTESDYRSRRRFAEIQRGELMVHQQDVRRALGIPRVIPQERVQEVLAFSLQPIGSLVWPSGANGPRVCGSCRPKMTGHGAQAKTSKGPSKLSS